MSDGWDRGRGGIPVRRVVGVVLVAAGLLATGSWALNGVLSPAGGGDVQPVPRAEATASGTPSPSSPAKPAPSPGRGTTRPSPSVSSTVTARLPLVSRPSATPGMDFGILVRVEQGGAGYRLVFDRAQWLDGGQAGRPQARIVNASTKLRTFSLRSGATIYGGPALAGSATATPISEQQLADRVTAAGGQVLVWLRHAGGADGPVQYVAEQAPPA